jgi:hypothetical protein
LFEVIPELLYLDLDPLQAGLCLLPVHVRPCD